METKRKVGRPLKFKTLKELTDKADKYFSDIEEVEWTITGLALALDTSRETLINYEKRDEYFDAIKRYKLMVHNAYEKDLRRKGRSGDIFALKNFGWSDVREIIDPNRTEAIEKIGEAIAKLRK